MFDRSRALPIAFPVLWIASTAVWLWLLVPVFFPWLARGFAENAFEAFQTFGDPYWQQLLPPLAMILAFNILWLIDHSRETNSAAAVRLYRSVSSARLTLILFSLFVGLSWLGLTYAESLLRQEPILSIPNILPSFLLLGIGVGSVTALALLAFQKTPQVHTALLRVLFALALSWTMLLATWGTSEILGPPLSKLTLGGANALLEPLFMNVTYDSYAQTIRIDNFLVRVWLACSGIEGVLLYTFFFSLLCRVYRRYLIFPNVLWLLPLGIAVSMVGNIIRVAVLIIIGSRISREVAMDGFHSVAGWIFFNVIAIGIATIALRSRYFSREIPLLNLSGERTNTPYLLPLVVILIARLVGPAFAMESTVLSPLSAVAGAVALFALRRRIFPLLQRFTWFAPTIGFGVAVLWIVLIHQTDAVERPWAHVTSTWVSVWFALRSFGFVFVTPVVEELAFRGYVMRRLTRAHYEELSYRACSGWAVLGSAVLFGLVHSHWMAALLAGLSFGWVAKRSGKLSDAVMAHVTTNLILMIYACLTGHWEVWS